ncbi:MAG: hypothetical protein HOC05_00970, partial [Gemmatimonadetes bacterium]|nr:hypothetical protein [Gemmatimonadota bacterium]
AKAALDAAKAAGAETYASSELSAAQSAYGTAKGAFDEEAGKMFKDWEPIASQISDAKAKADRARSSASSAKSQAKSGADGAIAAAAAAVSGAREALDAAPAGKGTEGDIEALGVSLDAADADLSAARSASAREDFAAASSKAASARTKADAVNMGVAGAVAKYEELVEKNTPWYMRGS